MKKVFPARLESTPTIILSTAVLKERRGKKKGGKKREREGQ
jgi:hypothetical protein